ncbi:hypothetical protein Tco_0730186 [Tanacetum coccineum]|uniref:Uncharacterized protein n=1 Tax=Tanacetum coccineum TaxID=301880 RepID=A0ABQ4YTK0_9ASTR
MQTRSIKGQFAITDDSCRQLLNIKVEFSVEDLEMALILQNSTLFENKVTISFGYKVLGWRSIPAYNIVIVRAFLFWVQDSLDEKCEVLLHPNGLSEDGTTTL